VEETEKAIKLKILRVKGEITMKIALILLIFLFLIYIIYQKTAWNNRIIDSIIDLFDYDLYLKLTLIIVGLTFLLGISFNLKVQTQHDKIITERILLQKMPMYNNEYVLILDNGDYTYMALSDISPSTTIRNGDTNINLYITDKEPYLEVTYQTYKKHNGLFGALLDNWIFKLFRPVHYDSYDFYYKKIF